MKYRRSVFHAFPLGLVFSFCTLAGTTSYAGGNALHNEGKTKLEKRHSMEQTKRSVRTERGIASWYGGTFHGKKTASGEVFDKNAFTLASRTLPLGTWVRVKNPVTNVEVEAKVNDHGPYVSGRIADLSHGLAKKLGITGVGYVVITVL